MIMLAQRDRSTSFAEPQRLLGEKEFVEAKARSKFRQSGYKQLQGIGCEFHEGALTLKGRVSSYYLKQIVQSLVLALEGVLEVHNRVVVVRHCPVQERGDCS